MLEKKNSKSQIKTWIPCNGSWWYGTFPNHWIKSLHLKFIFDCFNKETHLNQMVWFQMILLLYSWKWRQLILSFYNFVLGWLISLSSWSSCCPLIFLYQLDLISRRVSRAGSCFSPNAISIYVIIPMCTSIKQNSVFDHALKPVQVQQATKEHMLQDPCHPHMLNEHCISCEIVTS